MRLPCALKTEAEHARLYSEALKNLDQLRGKKRTYFCTERMTIIQRFSSKENRIVKGNRAHVCDGAHQAGRGSLPSTEIVGSLVIGDEPTVYDILHR